MTVDLSKKRPPKQISLSFILNQYASLKAGIPGLTSEIIQAQIAQGNYYLYESEVKGVIEQKKGEEGFDIKDFVESLKKWGCVKAGATPQIGEGLVRIDSIERAKEVANAGVNPEEVQKLMSQMVAIRDKVEPLIKEKASCSIALKNKKKKEKKAKTTTTS